MCDEGGEGGGIQAAPVPLSGVTSAWRAVRPRWPSADLNFESEPPPPGVLLLLKCDMIAGYGSAAILEYDSLVRRAAT